MPSLLHSSRLRVIATKVIPPLFYLLLILFLALYLRSVNFSKLAHLHLNWWYLGAASLLALTARYLGTYTWIVILRTLGASGLQLNRELLSVYAKAWMGRYIPGTAPWILGKIYFASQHGISKQKLAVGSLLEAGIQIVTLLVFSLALLVFDKRLDVLGMDFKVLMIAVALVGIIVLIPGVFNKLFSFAYRLLRRKTMDRSHLASGQTILYGSLLYLGGAVINGVSLFFIAKGVDPTLAYSNILFAAGAASLASAASMLAVFAPTGLGVREGIQLVLFALLMPKELALAVTFITRLWSVGIDFVFFGLSKLPANRSAAAPPGQRE